MPALECRDRVGDAVAPAAELLDEPRRHGLSQPVIGRRRHRTEPFDDLPARERLAGIAEHLYGRIDQRDRPGGRRALPPPGRPPR